MAATAAVLKILGAITESMAVSSQLAPSIATDVGILREAFSTGNNKKALQALRASNLNAAAQLAAYITNTRAALDANRTAIEAQVAASVENFGADGSISVDEFAQIMSLQSIAASITAGYQALQGLGAVQQQLEAASAAPK